MMICLPSACPQLMRVFYLYQLQSSEALEQVSTDEERQSFNEKLDEVSFYHNACSHIAHLIFLT